MGSAGAMRLLRLPLAATRLSVQLAVEVTKGALTGATRLAQVGYRAVTSSDGAAAEPAWNGPPSSPAAEAAARLREEAPPRRAPAPPPAEPPPAAPPPPEPLRTPEPIRPPEPVGVEPAVEQVGAEPAHVSEEPTFVADSAEIGAEDGAGAEVDVSEPWPGYDGMRAGDVRARLATADSAVAAAVSLYEASHKGRSSVLDAARRAVGS